MRAQRLHIVMLSTVLSACANPENTEALRIDTERVRQRVAEAKLERGKYGEGSPLHTLVTARIAVDEHTLAMLEQKSAALRWYPRFSYTVDGKGWQPPADAELQLRVAEEHLKKAEGDLMRARVEASMKGGLIGVMALLTAEMKAVPVAQLDYQVMALRHNFPVYAIPALALPEGAKSK